MKFLRRRKQQLMEITMRIRSSIAALACTLLLTCGGRGQVVSGVMTVTGAEMH